MQSQQHYNSSPNEAYLICAFSQPFYPKGQWTMSCLGGHFKWEASTKSMKTENIQHWINGKGHSFTTVGEPKRDRISPWLIPAGNLHFKRCSFSYSQQVCERSGRCWCVVINKLQQVRQFANMDSSNNEDSLYLISVPDRQERLLKTIFCKMTENFLEQIKGTNWQNKEIHWIQSSIKETQPLIWYNESAEKPKANISKASLIKRIISNHNDKAGIKYLLSKNGILEKAKLCTKKQITANSI